MKTKILLSTFLLLFVSISIFADSVNVDDARKVARNVYFERLSQFQECSMEAIAFDNEYSVKMNKHTLYYVFNLKNNKGFVMVAADNQSYPVLGYSFTGNLPEIVNHNISFNEFTEVYALQINQIIEEDLPANDEITLAWSTYLNDNFTISKSTQTVGPLMETKWDQDGFYDDLCPGGSLVGCVATAMSQVMRYHKHPTKGLGSHSYNSSYGTLTADFGATTYNYSNMPLEVTSANNDVATLCYHAGVSVDMNYSPNGSGASTQNAASSLISYFGYSNKTMYEYKDSYTDIIWKIKIRADIMGSRPVIYSGRGTGGHAFILDGFQYPDHFHVNWGWGGYLNGYFYLTALNPGSNNFSSQQGAILNLAPDPSYSGSAASIEEISSEDVISVYPNPTEDRVNIVFSQQVNESAKVKIYSIDGRVLKSIDVKLTRDKFSVDISDLKAGYYQLYIESESGIFVKPIIKN